MPGRRKRIAMRRLARQMAFEITEEDPDITPEGLEAELISRINEETGDSVGAGSAWLPIILAIIRLILELRSDD